MEINMIVCMSNNKVIWNNNELPWNYPEDLKYFKEKTDWNIVVMWLKTYESIWKPLKNRYNIVLTKQDINIEGVDIVDSIDSLKQKLWYLRHNSEYNKVFIIWWESIYEQLMPMTDRIYLTKLDKYYKWDRYFPLFEHKFREKSRIEWNWLCFIVYDRLPFDELDN